MPFAHGDSEVPKDCAFQYAAKDPLSGQWVMVQDTVLITSAEAEQLWTDHMPTFLQDFKNGKEPEMALWENMVDPGDYREQRKHWQSQDFIEHGGDLYQRVVMGD
jgi:hypothetical protein